ncbi:hypothetical protein RN001_009375 [Aquatica leii]|uniref:Uncharacterized protein n=1 Tax=Aquatica leii TaxID=1421715 RepID=A0AAN7SFL4_9COLE|nr:hypothetical protein RN001_009375 [Aquatica leii]
MKCSVVLFCLFFVKVASGNPQQVCLEKLNLDEWGLYSVLTNEETPLDNEYGKFFLCLWRTIGVMNKDDTINLKRLQEFGEDEIDRIRNVTEMDRKILKEKLSACKLKPLKLPEQTAVQIKNCHMKTIVDLF